MTITVSAKELRAAIAAVSWASTQRAKKPAISSILFRAEDGRATATCTDLDNLATITLDAETSGPDWACAVNVNALKRAIKGAAGMVTLSLAQSGALSVSSGGAVANVAAACDADDYAFCALPRDCEFVGPSLTIDAPMLARIVDRVGFAMSTEESRYYLCGAFIHCVKTQDGPEFRAAATGGHRLAVQKFSPAQTRGEWKGSLVSRATVLALGKIAGAKGYAGPVMIEQTDDGRFIRLAIGPVTVTTKLINGTFPDYERVIPTYRIDDDAVTSATVCAADVTRALAPMSGADKWSVSLGMSKGVAMRVYGATHDNGSTSDADVSADVAGPGLAIGFNASHLRDVMGAFNDATVTIRARASNDPAVMTSPSMDGYRVVLMPLRFGDVPMRAATPTPIAAFGSATPPERLSGVDESETPARADTPTMGAAPVDDEAALATDQPPKNSEPEWAPSARERVIANWHNRQWLAIWDTVSVPDNLISRAALQKVAPTAPNPRATKAQWLEWLNAESGGLLAELLADARKKREQEISERETAWKKQEDMRLAEGYALKYNGTYFPSAMAWLAHLIESGWEVKPGKAGTMTFTNGNIFITPKRNKHINAAYRVLFAESQRDVPADSEGQTPGTAFGSDRAPDHGAPPVEVLGDVAQDDAPDDIQAVPHSCDTPTTVARPQEFSDYAIMSESRAVAIQTGGRDRLDATLPTMGLSPSARVSRLPGGWSNSDNMDPLALSARFAIGTFPDTANGEPASPRGLLWWNGPLPSHDGAPGTVARAPKQPPLRAAFGMESSNVEDAPSCGLFGTPPVRVSGIDRRHILSGGFWGGSAPYPRRGFLDQHPR